MADQQTLTAFLYALLPGLGTVALAILSGAGGAALLELWWKPRRERRRAAALVHSDLMNQRAVDPRPF